jgi:hypothetical protein
MNVSSFPVVTSVFGMGAVTVRLCVSGGSHDASESIMLCRSQTAVDLIADVVRSNPFWVVVLDDIDCADNVAHNSILCTIKCDRLVDSHG